MQIAISWLLKVLAINSACCFLKSSLISFAYPPAVSASLSSSLSTITNLPPRLSTCSLAASLTSVAETTAPNLFAVAIACRPATPAPNTITFAGAIVPAAVIIIGIALLKLLDASMTAL